MAQESVTYCDDIRIIETEGKVLITQGEKDIEIKSLDDAYGLLEAMERMVDDLAREEYL